MKQTILKWFDLLNLPKEWRDTIEKCSENFDATVIKSHSDPYLWLLEQEDKMQGLLYALYKCEDFFNTAKKRNIPDDILLASLSEVKRYAVEYNRMTKGEKLGILQIRWIGKILNGNIYRLGRLEFELRGSLKASKKHGIAQGDSIIAVHIPDNGGPLTDEARIEAYRLAEEFLPKYFPEYKYEYYTCHSWMLDNTLKKFLKPSSNIVKFMDDFEITESSESLAALIYLFGRGTTLEDLRNITPETSLQKAVMEHINNGGKLYESFGVKKKNIFSEYGIIEKRILKWFDILEFPAEWKDETTEAIKKFNLEEIESQENPYSWLLEQDDKMCGMLYALYKCEDFLNNGLSKGISEKILIATLQEIRRHSQNYFKYYQKIGLKQIKWAEVILSGRLYCLGRLEFEMRTTQKTWENGGIIAPGASIISVHIPHTGGAMTDEECEESFAFSKEFFRKYFPDFDYKCYFCHSWLLDPTLRLFLKPDSNIVKFQNRFDITETHESVSGLGSIFGGGTTYENVLEKTPQTSLQKAAYEYIKNGGKLHEGYGFIKK